MSDLDVESDATRVAVQEAEPLTTADVKRRYSWGMTPHKSIPGGMYTVASAAADFDRWLTAHDAKVRADERAKRPDRERMRQLVQQALDPFHVYGAEFSIGDTDEVADAVLSSLALEPEAREGKLERLAAVTNINSITNAMLEEVGYPSHFHPADAPSWAYSVLEEEHEERTAPEAREEARRKVKR